MVGRGTEGRAGGAEAGEDLSRSSSAGLALGVWLSMGRRRPWPWEGAGGGFHQQLAERECEQGSEVHATAGRREKIIAAA